MGKFDFNFVEQVKIPEYSKLGNIGTPLRLFELFFEDALVDMTVDFTTLYGHREKADTSFESKNGIFCLFLGILLLSGHHEFSDRQIHRKTTLILLLKQCLPRNKFERSSYKFLSL